MIQARVVYEQKSLGVTCDPWILISKRVSHLSTILYEKIILEQTLSISLRYIHDLGLFQIPTTQKEERKVSQVAI